MRCFSLLFLAPSLPRVPVPMSTAAHSMAMSQASSTALASILGAPRMSGGPPFPRGPSNMSMRGSSLLRMRLPGGHPPHGSGLGLPSLHPRPASGGMHSGSGTPPGMPGFGGMVPAAAGPVSEQLQKMSSKLVDYMRGTLEDLFRELAAQGSPEAQVWTSDIGQRTY